MEFSAEQEAALDKIVAWFKDPKGQQVFYLAGFAGVGKTTITQEAINRLREGGNMRTVRTAAYTGKAASMMKKRGVENPTTIHSLIYVPTEDPKTGELMFILSVESPAQNCDLIVLDECSMIDDQLAKDLLSFNKPILVMGDPGQLPPIKEDGWLSNTQPDVFLQEIHRQAKDSPIIELATMARRREPLPIGYEKGNVKVVRMTKETWPSIYNLETQVICGRNSVRYIATQLIRTNRGYIGQKPLVGERLICCKNNHKLGFMNGQLATLQRIRETKENTYVIDVKFDDMFYSQFELEVDPVMFNHHFTKGTSVKKPWKLDSFDWGYVLTCHKAQGSQWKHVTVIDDSGYFKNKSEKWLYTAITRAEEGLTVLVR